MLLTLPSSVATAAITLVVLIAFFVLMGNGRKP